MYTQTLIEAATLIAYDNGAVNRTTTEDAVVTRMVTAAKLNFTDGEIEAVENFLAHLDVPDLVDLCVGEHGVVPSTELVEAVLETMFENM